MKQVSIVIPIYNEEEALPILLERVRVVMAGQTVHWELIFVNDGSRDRSLEILVNASLRNPNLRVLNLSRNFGHQAAISAGLGEAQGDCLILMDGDLQDPPEAVPEILSAWKAGAQVVVAARRTRAERGLRRLAFESFYWVFGLLADFPVPLSAGVFCLLDRVVVDQMLQLEERNRFIPGLRSWLGFRQVFVWYDRSERAAGKPKQTFWRLLRYGVDALFSFSYKPLRLSWALGIIISMACFVYAVALLALRILQINVVPGFTTPTVALLFLGGIQLITTGILGEYLGRIYDEVKRRPLFIVAERYEAGALLETNSRKGSSRQ